jgi:hypothetical protein
MLIANFKPGSNVVCRSSHQGLVAGKSYTVKYNSISRHTIMLCLLETDGIFDSEDFTPVYTNFAPCLEALRKKFINRRSNVAQPDDAR